MGLRNVLFGALWEDSRTTWSRSAIRWAASATWDCLRRRSGPWSTSC